jgi:hypothetical protein
LFCPSARNQIPVLIITAAMIAIIQMAVAITILLAAIVRRNKLKRTVVIRKVPQIIYMFL